jgi:hypothetical protein
MKRLAASMGFLVVMSTLWSVDVIAPLPSLASWVSANCSPNHANVAVYRRKDAQAYATVARSEGYEWGGGCWNDNNRDDTPGQPDSYGEGPDCSGLVFKTWELRNTAWDTGFTWYDKLENVHGRFTTWNYKSPVGSDPFVRLPDKSRDRMMYMDAFSSDTHVGMLWTGASPGSNTDYVMEALGDAYGTDVFVESYRSDSRYVGVRRENWTPDCYPNCRGPEAVEVVP